MSDCQLPAGGTTPLLVFITQREAFEIHDLEFVCVCLLARSCLLELDLLFQLTLTADKACHKQRNLKLNALLASG